MQNEDEMTPTGGQFRRKIESKNEILDANFADFGCEMGKLGRKFGPTGAKWGAKGAIWTPRIPPPRGELSRTPPMGCSLSRAC